MNKDQLSKQLHQALRNQGMTSRLAVQSVTEIIRIMRGAVIQGQSISMRGFGTIQYTTMQAKEGRNFQTGLPVHIPKRHRIRFVPSFQLTQIINERFAEE